MNPACFPLLVVHTEPKYRIGITHEKIQDKKKEKQRRTTYTWASDRSHGDLNNINAQNGTQYISYNVTFVRCHDSCDVMNVKL